ncbi:MAG: hypothetical protein H7067_01875 [Burkholderiales bacterium]|nr:hypothetical protein [Opitutaceae bacterium]
MSPRDDTSATPPMRSAPPPTRSSLLLASLLALVASARADLVPEGRFESGLNAQGVPKGWVIDPPGWKNSPHLSFNFLSEARDSTEGAGENHFVRLGNTAVPDEESVFRLALVKTLPSPAPSRLTLGWRVRAAIEATSRVNGWSSVQLTIRFLDDKGQQLSEQAELFRLVRSTQGRWIQREITVAVPAGAAEIELLPGLYLVRGSVDFDDITVSAATN